jgi:hypothetical protein
MFRVYIGSMFATFGLFRFQQDRYESEWREARSLSVFVQNSSSSSPEHSTMASPMGGGLGNSRRTQHIEASGSEGRGGGTQTAAERVADLLKADEHGIDDAFGSKEKAATKSRNQWKPAPSDYEEAMHGHSGHGLPVPAAPGGFGYVSLPDASRHPNAGTGSAGDASEQELAGAGTASMQGPSSQTKDWRTEGSRIGRYWQEPTFKLKPYGEWEYKEHERNGKW